MLFVVVDNLNIMHGRDACLLDRLRECVPDCAFPLGKMSSMVLDMSAYDT
ncbi:MAG: hypothetical protein C5S48_03665 [Candidatus Methanogaster sp.]|nr:MAG: hypothetical protein C5S48_03665 [ANME-2 cluster archaeon]